MKNSAQYKPAQYIGFESMEHTLEKTWLSVLDEVIVWSISAFILLLPLPHVNSLKSIAMILPVVAWTAKMLIQQKFLFKKNTLSWPILGYIGACLLSLVHSVNPTYSLDEIRSKVISPVLLYLVIINTLKQKHLRIIFNSFLVSATMISVYGIWGLINGTEVVGGRAILTFHHPTTAGLYVCILIALSLGLIYIAKSGWGKAGVISCLLISLIALFLTQARGAIAAGLFAFILFALLKDKRLLGGMLLALIILLPLMPGKTIDRATSIVDIHTYTDKNTTIHSRYGIWQASVLLLEDNWLWGVGYGWKNTRRLLTEYKHKYRLDIADAVVSHSHNTFLQEWLELGIIGFIMFVWLFINIVREMWPVFRYGLKKFTERIYTPSTVVAICGLFIANMTDLFLRYKTVYLFWIMLGVFMLLMENNRLAE